MPSFTTNFHATLDEHGDLVVGSLIFTDSAVDPSWTAAYDAVVCGVDHLRLNIGRLEERGLEQSFLSTMNAKPFWKKINADLKKRTTAGATLIWEDGDTRFDRHARFTAGARVGWTNTRSF